MSSSEPAIPPTGPEDAPPTAEAGQLPSKLDAVAEVPESARAVRGPKKRPCFHCGAMTSVKVLEKTGDLCWRCYRPAGYSLLKNLMVLTVSLLLLAGLLVSWKVYSEEGAFLSITPRRQPQDYKPREFTTEQKVQILRRHLLDRVPAKELCDEYEVPPTEFARWKQQFFENAEATFEQLQSREPNATERRAQAMEQKIQVIEKMLSDLRDHLTLLKKESGKYESSPTQRYILESAGPPPRENK
jgi:transposase